MTQDEATGSSATTDHRGRRVVVARLLMLWVFVVAVYFLWEADRYRGLYALLAEFQFNYLGQHWPVLTFALLLIVFGSPAAWLLRTRKPGEVVPGADGPREGMKVSANFRRVLFAFSGGLAGAAAITFLWTLTLPRVSPPEETIAIGSPQSASPKAGPVTLQGEILYRRTSAFAQFMLVKRRGVRFAPIVAPGSKDGNIRYFIELLPDDRPPPTDAQQAQVSIRSGVLMRNNLPGSIVRLYRYAGYRVERPFYVLYASSTTIRWPYYVTGAQLALAALVTLIAALVQHRHVVYISHPREKRRRKRRTA